VAVAEELLALLSVAFAIVGIIAEARGAFVIGLLSTSWYLLTIASFVFSLGCWLGWAVGATYA